jgi:hypothetical protein
MVQSILYIFNSASRPLYEVNVLNVLAVPHGATTVHRYWHKDVYLGEGKDSHPVWPKRIPLGALGRRTKRRLAGGATQVVFVFVDRHDESRYHPLRCGQVYEKWDRDGWLYLRVRWGDFVTATSQSRDYISGRIGWAVNHKGPHPGEEPGAIDGAFAVFGKDVLESKVVEPGSNDPEGLLKGEEAWIEATKRLAGTKQFENRPDRRVVFLRAELQPEGENRAPVKVAGRLERQVIRKNLAYVLRISYYDAAHEHEPPEAPAAESTLAPGAALPAPPASKPAIIAIHTEVGDNLQLLTSAPIRVEAAQDDSFIPLAVKRYADDRYSYLRVDVRAVHESPDIDVLGPRVNALLAVREPGWFWPAVILLAGLFAAAAFVLGTPTGEDGWWPSTWHTRLRAAAALVQAFTLIVLLRLVGKKPL